MKKVAVVAMTAAMTVAMGCLAYAGDGSTYKVVGAEGLVGESWEPAATTDSTEPGAPGEMGLMTELSDNPDVYSVSFDIAAADDGEGDTKNDDAEVPVGYEFKILKDADDFAWTYQCCLGNPSVAWGDNQTQFKLPADTTGKVTVYLDSTTGAVVIADEDNNGLDYVVRWKSRDEDPWDFTAATKSAIEASVNPTTNIQNSDCQDVEAINAALAEKVGVTLSGASSEDGEDTTTIAEDTKEDTTTASSTTTTKAAEEEESSNTGVIVVVVIVVVVLIAAVAIVMNKKKN